MRKAQAFAVVAESLGYFAIFILMMALLAQCSRHDGVQCGTAYAKHEAVAPTYHQPNVIQASSRQEDGRPEQDVSQDEQETDWTAEAVLIAKVLYGEARGCSEDEQEQVVWCILNRVDDERFPDSIEEVVTQANQFYGYSSEHPVWQELFDLAWDVLERWESEKQGEEVERNLSAEYLYFSGDGTSNYFRVEY